MTPSQGQAGTTHEVPLANGGTPLGNEVVEHVDRPGPSIVHFLGRFQDRAVLLVLLAASIIGFGLASQNFFTISNATTILASVAVLAILSTGQTFAIVSGGFDLGITGTVPLAGIMYVFIYNAGVPWVPAVVATVAIGAGVGAVSGGFVGTLGINPLIVTLGMASVAGGAAEVLAKGSSVSLQPATLNWIGGASVGTLANTVWVALVVVLVGWAILRFTVPGVSLYAIGGNREAAWLAGIRVRFLTFSVYMFSGALSGLAGAIITSELLVGSPSVAANDALESIAAVVLGGGALTGGVGDPWGTSAAVLVLGVIADGLILLQVSPFYQEIATGAVLLLVVSLARARTKLAEQ